MSDELAAWLRAEITGDAEASGARLRRQMSDGYRHQVWEKHARAKAELAILHEHQVLRRGEDEDFFNRGLTVVGRMPPAVGLLTIGETDGDFGCVACHYVRGGHIQGFGWCRTLRHLGSGYRRRPGYKEEWKP